MKSGIGKTVARNFSILFGAKAMTWISSFVLLMFLPRYLGDVEYGRLYLALSIKLMLGLLIDFGGAYLIPKEVARSEKEGKKILSSYIVMRIFLWVFSLGVILILINLLGYSEQVNLLILVLSISMLWEGGSKAFKAYFQGIERMEYPSLGMITEKVSVAVISVVALLLGADSIEIAVIMTVGALLNLIVVYWYARKFVSLSYNFDFKVFNLLQSGMPYFLFTLFSVIYYRVDAMMLASMTTEEVTGWYGGAYRFFDIVMLLPLLYQTAIFPVFSKLWDNVDGMLQTTVGKSLKLMLILAVPAALLIFLFSENIIQFFMGLEDYSNSVVILQIFSLSIPLIYMDLIIGSAILGAANRQRGWAIVGFIAIFLNIGANLWLIPHFQSAYMNGGIGAAIATFITEAFMFCCALYLIPLDYLRTFRLSHVMKPVISGAVMVAAILLINLTGLYWMITAAIGAILYIGGLFLLRLFDDDEMRMLKSLMWSFRRKAILSIKNVT